MTSRDVKPSNCVMQPSASTNTETVTAAQQKQQQKLGGDVWLLDFGLACTCEELQVRTYACC